MGKGVGWLGGRDVIGMRGGKVKGVAENLMCLVF